MKYILKKLGVLIVTLLIISMLAFLAFQIIPGDPTTKMLGTQYTPERAAALAEELGLNENVVVRYLKWLGSFFGGDMGQSYSYSMSVKELIGDKLIITSCLSLMAFILVVIVSVPMGMALARYKNSLADKIMTVLNQIGMSIPPFFMGMIFTFLFGLVLKLFTPGDFVSFRDSVGGFFAYLIFPAIAIAIPRIAMTVKLLRSSILTEMKEDYVRTAYSRGNSRWMVLRDHVLRNAVIPVVTFLAMTLADIVAGSIIVEQVFSIPGLGRLLLSSISNRDFPVVQAIIVIIACIVITANFLADIACQYIDPRIRLS